jgi:hypothetical protein
MSCGFEDIADLAFFFTEGFLGEFYGSAVEVDPTLLCF